MEKIGLITTHFCVQVTFFMGIWNAGIDCYLSKELTKNDLQVADALGSVRDRIAITPNMHMHTHLKSGIESLVCIRMQYMD